MNNTIIKDNNGNTFETFDPKLSNIKPNELIKGNGKLTMINGDIYEGTGTFGNKTKFIFEGEGRLTKPTGEIYECKFIAGYYRLSHFERVTLIDPKSIGKVIYKNGNIKKGYFIYDKLTKEILLRNSLKPINILRQNKLDRDDLMFLYEGKGSDPVLEDTKSITFMEFANDFFPWDNSLDIHKNYHKHRNDLITGIYIMSMIIDIYKKKGAYKNLFTKYKFLETFLSSTKVEDVKIEFFSFVANTLDKYLARDVNFIDKIKRKEMIEHAIYDKHTFKDTNTETGIERNYEYGEGLSYMADMGPKNNFRFITYIHYQGSIYEAIFVIFLFFEIMPKDLQTLFAVKYMTDFIEGYESKICNFEKRKKNNTRDFIGSCAPGNFKKLLYSVGSAFKQYFSLEEEKVKEKIKQRERKSTRKSIFRSIFRKSKSKKTLPNNSIVNKEPIFDCNSSIIKNLENNNNNKKITTENKHILKEFLVSSWLQEFLQEDDIKKEIDEWNDKIEENEILNSTYEEKINKIYESYVNYISSTWKKNCKSMTNNKNNKFKSIENFSIALNIFSEDIKQIIKLQLDEPVESNI
jgi:hypothetical protein